MIPAETAQKLAKLLPLLASDNDGETLATARAIVRALQGAELDLHDLARAVAPPVHSDRHPYWDAIYTGSPLPTAEAYSYANGFKQATPVGIHADHPDALTVKLGLPIERPDRIDSWRDVARYSLDFDKATPKHQDGRFLLPFQTKELDEIRVGKRWPTNAKASWIETVLARCHQIRDKIATTAGGGTP